MMKTEKVTQTEKTVQLTQQKIDEKDLFHPGYSIFKWALFESTDRTLTAYMFKNMIE